MDPDQTLSDLFDAMAEGDAELAKEHAANLQQWLERGGFTPLLRVLVGGEKKFTLSPELVRSVCTSIINFAETRTTFAKPTRS